MKMNIIKISKSIVHFIETDEEQFYVYKRYSADYWVVRMGESDEPIFHNDKINKLETLFQDHLKKIGVK